MTELPTTFLLYIRSRKSSADPYSGFIHVKAELPTNEINPTRYQLTPEPVTQPFTITKMPNVNGYSYMGQIAYVDKTNMTVRKPTNDWSAYCNVKDSAGQPVHILEITTPACLFAMRLKRNVQIIGPVPVLFPPTGGEPAAQTQTQTQPVRRKVLPALPTLNIHVARQLLELAQLRKDMCPIIVEEFVSGHTAAMPCGHLFSQLAIEESFKVKMSQCPACRQDGTPCYV